MNTLRNPRWTLALLPALLVGCGAASGGAASAGVAPADAAYRYLWPEEGPFERPSGCGYDEAVASVLFRARYSVRRLQAVVLGANAPEAVFVEEIPVGGAFRYNVVHVRAVGSINGALKTGAPLAGVQTATGEASIDEAAFQAIERIWTRIVSSVRNDDSRPAIADGSQYHFSSIPVAGARAGYTENPPDHTVAMGMVGLQELLSEYADADAKIRPAVRAKILKAVTDLERMQSASADR